MSTYRDQLYVGEVSFRSKGYTKSGKRRAGGSFEMEVQIPGIRGQLSAGQIGAMYASELIDLVRTRWRRGRNADNRPNLIYKKTKALRAYHAGVITGSNTAISSLEESIKQQQDRLVRLKEKRSNMMERKRKGYRAAVAKVSASIRATQERIRYRKKKLKKAKKVSRGVPRRYQLRTTTTRMIDGVKTRRSNRSQYVPKVDNPSLYASGLMADSLRGRYRPARSYTDKEGKRVTVRSNVTLTVAASRTFVAGKYGGMHQGAHFLAAFHTGAFPTTFPGTAALIDNGLYWKSENSIKETKAADARARMEMLRAIVRGLQFIERMTQQMGSIV